MIQDNIARAYDEWASTYDLGDNKTRDLDQYVIRTLPADYLTGDVLELGCGTGKNTERLAERARSILALDFSAGMLAVARRHVSSPKVTFVEHDIREALPCDSQSFDFVTADLVLEHLPDLAPVFGEVARVLRPGGRLHVCELHPQMQTSGMQAQYTAPSGAVVLVDAYRHRVSDYLNAALSTGLVLESARELNAPGDQTNRGPRVLSLIWLRP